MGVQSAHMVPVQDGASSSRRLAIALQGGGTYGAFAWGVLDRLLEQEDFDPVAFSGASAGAVNATLLTWGLMQGGRDGARQALRQFWEAVGRMSLFSPLGLPGAHLHFDLLTRIASPYQFNPLNINPMRDLLSGMVDFEQLRRHADRSLFIAATEVESGALRIFRENEISVDVLLASTCIPYLHQAVEVEGRSYWDGGFSSNPPILPLVLETQCTELLVVKLTPDREAGYPTTAPAIFSRLKRILFNTPLLRELDSLEQMQDLLRRSAMLSADLRRVRDLDVRHATIEAAFFQAREGGSALHPRPEFLGQLFDAGRAKAEALIPVTARSALG